MSYPGGLHGLQEDQGPDKPKPDNLQPGDELYLGRAGISGTLEAFGSQREAERWVGCSPVFRRVWKVTLATADEMTYELPSAGRLVLPQRDLYPREDER